MPDNFGPYTTCYNRFVRWRQAGVWAKIMNALAGAHDAAVQMIDTSIVRVHQHGACISRNYKLAANYLAFVQLASIRLWLRANESAPLVKIELVRNDGGWVRSLDLAKILAVPSTAVGLQVDQSTG